MQITKREVDHYQPGKRIPMCVLVAQFTPKPKKEVIPDLHCCLDLIGAKLPHNTFVIDIKAPQTLGKYDTTRRASTKKYMYMYAVVLQFQHTLASTQ